MQVAGRFNGMSALEPFLQMFKDMRHMTLYMYNLKKPSSEMKALHFETPAPAPPSTPTQIL